MVHDRLSRWSYLAFIIVLAGVVTACAPRITTRGNLPDPELLAEIKPGEATRQEVAQILGSPSTSAIFDQESWYYISERTETTAFFEPKVTAREVVAIRFNPQGVVSKIETIGMDAGRNVEPVERETPTVGHELTLLKQLFGNLGRFNKRK